LDSSSPNRELAEATLAAIAKHGFYLTHAANYALPAEPTRSRAKSIEEINAIPNITS
jgi:hypothetical protein